MSSQVPHPRDWHLWHRARLQPRRVRHPARLQDQLGLLEPAQPAVHDHVPYVILSFLGRFLTSADFPHRHKSRHDVWKHASSTRGRAAFSEFFMPRQWTTSLKSSVQAFSAQVWAFQKNSVISFLPPFKSPPAGADCPLPFTVLFYLPTAVSCHSNALMA